MIPYGCKELPSKLGYRLPAEWEPHEATWLGWPHNRSDWPGRFSPIPWVYAEIVRRITPREKVRIIVESRDHEREALKTLKAANVGTDNIEFFKLKTDRGWTRDSMPQFIRYAGGIAQVNFRFNGWAKYPDYKKDRNLPRFVSTKLELPVFHPSHNGKPVVLEGGAIDNNGRGALITTEECLLDENIQTRNTGFSKSDYERVFADYLGIRNILWLGRGIAGDDTHGHVDDLCRFANEKTLVLVEEKKFTDENYKPLCENKERVADFRLPDGSGPEVVFLPMPGAVIFKGRRLPASYANFYISNSAVLVPTFDDPNDRVALGIIRDVFSDRQVIGIHSLDLVWGLGTIHCLTHEQPAI